MFGVHALQRTNPEHKIDGFLDMSSNWKVTPYISSDERYFGESFWALTLSCTWLDDGLQKKIRNALAKPGSFFRRYKAGVTLVIPSAGIVVYLFYD